MNYLKQFSAILLLAVLTNSVKAQRSNFYKKWSAEVSYGATHLLTPKSGMNLANHISPQFLKAELRYMFTPVIGLSSHYAHTSLVKLGDYDTDRYASHRLGLEGVLHLGNLLHFDGDGLYQYVNILVHSGAGISITNDSDQMLSIMAGISPQVRLSKKVALKLDASYVANLKQDLGYRGEELTSIETGKAVQKTGQLLNYSIGLQYYFGRGKVASDW